MSTPQQHPDAEILSAFIEYCQRRGETYRHDTEESPLDYGEWDDLADAALGRIRLGHATSIEGVCARLQVAITEVDTDRWVDSTLTQEGFEALYVKRDDLDGGAAQIAIAVHELKAIHQAGPAPAISPEILVAFEAWKMAELASYYAQPCPDEIMNHLADLSREARKALEAIRSTSSDDVLLKLLPRLLMEFESSPGEPPLRPALDRLTDDLARVSPVLGAAMALPSSAYCNAIAARSKAHVGREKAA